MYTIKQGDALEVLRTLEAESIDCCVTSPPYWGLRDYGESGQLGLEATPEEYVAKLVAVLEEVRRVLKPQGTLWLNLGDSYASSGAAGVTGKSTCIDNVKHVDFAFGRAPTPDGLKPKDLVGIPWRVAFALQSAGWWLRSDIIWAKDNPMPESVTDRPTKSHEYLFLLAKSERYYYDVDAIREPSKPHILQRKDGMMSAYKCNEQRISNPETTSKFYAELKGANARTVWRINTAPYAEAHFATFPIALPERCIRAGCPVNGIVLDPFGGSGTTAVAALRNNRKALLIELNPEYVTMAHRRIEREAGGQQQVMFADNDPTAEVL